MDGTVPSPSSAFTVTLTGGVAAFAALPAEPPRVRASPVSVATTAAGHHGRPRPPESRGMYMSSSQAKAGEMRSGVIVWTRAGKRQARAMAHPV